MKSKILIFTTLLLPSIVLAAFDPSAWLQNVKITTYTRPKPVAQISSSSAPALIDPLRIGLVAGAAAFSEQMGSLSNQVAQLKSENESLKKTIASLNQKISSLLDELTGARASYQKSLEKVEATYSPENITKIKQMEWVISGDIDNNFRYRIDENGELTNERVLNIRFFREGQTAEDFQTALKQYDDLVGSNLADYAKKFIEPSGEELARFQDFYNYFKNVRKFPR